MHPFESETGGSNPHFEKEGMTPNNFPTWKKSFWYFTFVVACMQVKIVINGARVSTVLCQFN
jgi:hypothetical protein